MPRSAHEQGPSSPSPNLKGSSLAAAAAAPQPVNTDSKPTISHVETVEQKGTMEKNPDSTLATPPTLKPSSGGMTFANQDSLPRLPIPDLEVTCKKYLETLQPLQTAREHEDSKSAVREFLMSGGPELQEKLKKYATSKSSYIEQFCRFFFSW